MTSKQPEKGSLEDSALSETAVVDWDGDDDPANPRNWPKAKGWAHVVIISVLALITNMAPTMCAPGIRAIEIDLNIASSAGSTLAVTLYVLGMAIGPIQSLAQFLIFRFLSGCAGGTPMALGGGTIADITTIQKRAVAMALFSMGPLAGPVLGPVVGGFVAAGLGWLAGVTALVIMRETHPKVILERKAARLRATTGHLNLRSKLAGDSLPPGRVLLEILVRPTMLLCRSPILSVMSLYVALVFGVMYLLFTTFPSVFEGQYGFSTSISGLVYLGLGVALVASMLLFNVLNGRVQAARVKADGAQQARPEDRLLLMIWFSPFVGLGLIIYGWTAYYQVHWIVPIIGTMPSQLYLVDVFGSQAAASALGANNLLRYISSTFLPLAGPALYHSLDYGWGNTLLGLLALAFVPGPLLFYRYGERLRAK
ncbi:major facilitator superfamily domain-containing protein [Aspergillus desertorum]